jgi:hypothetical protein
MKNKEEIELPEAEISQINENYEDKYWSKEYEITPEDLKKKGYHTGVYNKIVDAYINKQNLHH